MEQYMALSRRTLRAMGIEDDKVEEIIAAHVETVDALKAERDEAKAEAAKVQEVQQRLDDALKTIEAAKGDDWKAMYEQEHADYEAYKATQAKKEADAAKAKAYREQVLGAAHVDPARMDAIMRLVDLDSFEVGEDGSVKDAQELVDGAAKEWAAFVQETHTRGASVPTPPTSSNAAGGDPHAAELVAQRMAQYGVKQQ